MFSCILRCFVFPLLLTLGASACATSSMTSEMRSAIPRNATTILLTSDSLPADLYEETYRKLRLKGCRFSEANERMMSLTTEPCTVGKSQSTLRIDVLVEPEGDGCRLVATADYELVEGEWRPVAFRDSGTKYKVGFEELALLMDEVSHTDLRYEVDEERSRRAFSL